MQDDRHRRLRYGRTLLEQPGSSPIRKRSSSNRRSSRNKDFIGRGFWLKWPAATWWNRSIRSLLVPSTATVRYIFRRAISTSRSFCARRLSCSSPPPPSKPAYVERFALEPRTEIAVMSASHHGEPFHIEAVAVDSAQDRNGCESALQCGAHYAVPRTAGCGTASADDAGRRAALTDLQNNCSGQARRHTRPVRGDLAPIRRRIPRGFRKSRGTGDSGSLRAYERRRSSNVAAGNRRLRHPGLCNQPASRGARVRARFATLEESIDLRAMRRRCASFATR